MNRLLGRKILTLMLTVIMILGMTIVYAEDGIKFHYKDDFNDFNSNFWTVVDKNGPVLEAMDITDGIITITARKTDNYPTLISKGIPIEMGDQLVIKRRTYAHSEHTYFAPSAYVTEEMDTSWNMDPNRDKNSLFYFQHLNFTYAKGRYPEALTKGNFGFARLDNFTKVNELAAENYGITRSTLDEWVDEEFIYDTVTGDVTITSGGETMNFKGRPLEYSHVRFQMTPYGWYTGQYDQMDWIDIKVISSDTVVSTNGILKGLVLDFNGELSVPEVTVNLVKEGQVLQTVTTDSNGEYKFSVAAGIYDLTLNKSGFIGATYSAVESITGQTTYLETILQVPQGSGIGSVSGEILNAVTGNLEPNVVIEVRQGINNKSGAAETLMTADGNGHYVFSGASGYYTFQTKKDGFINKIFSTSIQGGTEEVLSDVAISPVLLAGQIRIVLRWNTTPADLDSHLSGPTNEGALAHVYFIDTEYRRDNTLMILDVDDQDGEGPETITVTKPLPGVYTYSVHDYTNSSDMTSNMLANSMAAVEVYIGNAPVKVFNVPNQPGTLWKVFTYDGTSIHPVNSMTYQEDESTIR